MKKQIKRVCDSVRFSSIKHIVFTSSCSVYPKDDKLYLPTDKFIPPNTRAEILLDCEEALCKLKNISVITIRLGGIYSVTKKIITLIKLAD